MRSIQQAQLFVENEERGLLARAIAAATKTMARRDLPVPAGPRISVLDPRLDAAAEKPVEFGDAARSIFLA